MLDPLLDAQLAQAIGRKYLVTRDKRTKKFTRVGPAMARNSKEETIEVWETDPSTPAFSDLLNRAADRPAEQVQEIKLSGTVNVVTERLEAARAVRAVRAKRVRGVAAHASSRDP